MGATPDEILTHLRDHPQGEGIVVGDEMRLRQIVTNLARLVTQPLSISVLTEMDLQQCLEIYCPWRQIVNQVSARFFVILTPQANTSLGLN